MGRLSYWRSDVKDKPEKDDDGLADFLADAYLKEVGADPEAGAVKDSENPFDGIPVIAFQEETTY
jgi:hypothetical protein